MDGLRRAFPTAFCGLAALLLTPVPSPAQSVEAFYQKARQITVVVSTNTGGG